MSRGQSHPDFAVFSPSPPECLQFADDGRIPNSPFPVLVYQGVVERTAVEAMARHFEDTFARNGWPPDWRDGVYAYHHYHSTAHEVLGIAAGSATLMLGGEQGAEVAVAAGDVVVLPAGTGHCALSHSTDFLVVGAYPAGQRWDIMRGRPDERPAALERIRAVPFPVADPVGGELLERWNRR